MQTIVTWFLVLALPHVMAKVMDGSEVDGDGVVKKHVVVHRIDGDSDGDGTFTIKIDTGDGEVATQVIDLADGGKFAFVGDGRSDGAVVTKVIRIGSDKNAADRGWLGVSIGNVPEALSTQLDLDGGGLLVVNVVDGGPADLAGIQSHDVIISLDGEAVTGDFGTLTKLLSDRKPGDAVNVVVLQDGEEKVLAIELGTRDDVNSFSWKFDVAANLGEVEELIHTTGKMMIHGDDGEWNVIDLGDLSDLELLKDLPESIRLAIPKSGNQTTQVFFRDGKHTVKSTVTRDGESISVSRENGDDIIVTRTDVDGYETEATYATEEDLEVADIEAFDLFTKAGHAAVIKLDIDGDFGFGDATFDFDLDLGEDFDIDAIKDKVMVWRQHMGEALGDADEVRGQLQVQLEAMLQDIREGDGDGLAHLKFLPMLHGKDAKRMHFGQFRGKVHQSFEVRPDGTIAVTVRKGDSEVVNIFTDEVDLADRAPDLFEKYLKVVGDDD